MPYHYLLLGIFRHPNKSSNLLKGDDHEASTTTDSSASAASSKTSTPGPNDHMPGLLSTPSSNDSSLGIIDPKTGLPSSSLSGQTSILPSTENRIDGKPMPITSVEGMVAGQNIRPANSNPKGTTYSQSPMSVQCTATNSSSIATGTKSSTKADQTTYQCKANRSQYRTTNDARRATWSKCEQPKAYSTKADNLTRTNSKFIA